jgi:hypothetical protein
VVISLSIMRGRRQCYSEKVALAFEGKITKLQTIRPPPMYWLPFSGSQPKLNLRLRACLKVAPFRQVERASRAARLTPFGVEETRWSG